MSEYGKVQAQDDPNMGIMAGDDEVKVEDDHFELLVGDEDFIIYINASEIGKDLFSLTRVDETAAYVFDLTCNM